MKKYLLVIILSVTFNSNIFGQFNFQRLIGGSDHDRAQTIFETFDNGFIISGASFSFGAGNVDAILIKTDNLGQTSWGYAYGTTEYDNSEFAIETFDRNIVCSGRSNIQPGLPTASFIFKTDSAGNLLWSKSYGGNSNDNLVQVIETSDNGYAAIGFSESLSSGSSDILFIKTDINGDTIFTRSYGTIEDEDGLSIVQLPDDGYVITGRQITYPNGKQESDGLLLRTDGSGNLLWTKQYGDSLWEELTAAKRLSDGGFIISGSTSTFGAGNYDILLMRTDSSGNVQWSRTFGKDYPDAGYDIHVNADSSYVISGYTEDLGYGHLMGDSSSNIFLLKTNSIGEILWMQTFGDGLQDEAFRSAKTGDGGYVIPGFTTNYIFTDSAQMIFIKTDSLGFTGCHEERVTPVDSVITMPFQSVGFIQLSGLLPVGNFTLIKTSITPTNDDACLFSSANSNNHSEINLNVYPNPFNKRLNIESENNESLEIIIYDIFSRKIISAKFIKSISINTDEFANGVFIYEVKNEKSIVRKGKIVK